MEGEPNWILAPKSELVALLSGFRGLHLKEAKILSEEHKAVLLVVIGHRQKGGVSNSLPLIGTLRRRGRLLRDIGRP
jgi:hypothetical protein